MFSQMRQAAILRLNHRDPETLTRNAGAVYDAEKRAFLLSTFGGLVERMEARFTEMLFLTIHE